MSLHLRLVAPMVSLVLVGCPQETPTDDAFGGGSVDAGQVADAGDQDIAPSDTGTPDAGTKDAGTKDAGKPDTGDKDAGQKDAGQKDAGPKDAGKPDAGCKGPSDCDDGDPCTIDICSAGACDTVPADAWAKCGDGKQCAPEAGCIKTVRGSAWMLELGGDTTCSVLDDDVLWCWGRNNLGQLGTGKATSGGVGSVWPVASAAVGKVLAVAVGGEHVCAIDSKSKIRCWGQNMYGQLGRGPGAPKNTPVPAQIKSTLSFVQVAASISHTCAIDIKGAVHCWGLGGSGCLGDGNGKNSDVPVKVQALSAVERITVGEHFSCAKTLNQDVWCWGTNGKGQLGDGKGGTSKWSNVPVKLPVVAGKALDVAAGRDHACARTTAGEVLCWGANNHAQLGQGKVSQYEASPKPVTLPLKAQEISVGEHNTCAWRPNDKAWCWGRNIAGQTGRAKSSMVKSPAEIKGLLELEEMAVGENHICAAVAGAKVACWGDNYNGQLGIGTSGNSTTTPKVAGPPPP